MHTRDYSEETSRVIDEEVERILREQEERASAELLRHRKGLDAVAAALLDKETIDGTEVGRLVDDAYGRPVHGDGRTPPLRSSVPGPGGPQEKVEAQEKQAEPAQPAAARRRSASGSGPR